MGAGTCLMQFTGRSEVAGAKPRFADAGPAVVGRH